MTVTGSGFRSLAAITDSVGLAEARGWRLNIFIKEDHDDIKQFIYNLRGASEVRIFNETLESGLIDSLTNFAKDSSLDKKSWIQVIAEDDPILVSRPMDALRLSSEASVAICPMARSNLNGVEYEKALRLKFPINGKSLGRYFRHRQIFADTGWHGAFRSDVFVDHFTWLSSLPVIFQHHSRSGIWLAAARGDIDLLPDILIVKDCTWRVSPEVVRNRQLDWYISQGARPEDYLRDLEIYYLGVIAELCVERSRNPSQRLENVLGMANNLHRLAKLKPKLTTHRLKSLPIRDFKSPVWIAMHLIAEMRYLKRLSHTSMKRRNDRYLNRILVKNEPRQSSVLDDLTDLYSQQIRAAVVQQILS